MGFREKLDNYNQKVMLKRYGDRMVQYQGNVVSVKVETKVILWIFHKLTATVIIRPDRSKNIVKCVYKRNRWFKDIPFISIKQGNLVQVMGLKGKKGKENRDIIQILNILNLTTKKDLVPIDNKPKREIKYQRIK